MGSSLRTSACKSRRVARTAARLGVGLLVACSSAHAPNSSDSSDPEDPRGQRDGASGPGDGAQGRAPSDPTVDPGDPNDPNMGATSPPRDPNDDPPGAQGLTCVIPAVGPSPLRRLTHFEYDNSVRDLLGDTSAPGTRFAPDSQRGLFDNALETQTVSVQLGEQYLDAAVALAEAAALDRVVGCDPSSATCMRDFITRFGRRAFRRPLTPAELDEMLATFGAGSTAVDANTGARAVIAAFLASPKFVFRPEYGGRQSVLPDAKQLTAFELAARLASLLWASLPDDALLDLAASGQLESAEQVAMQARRMLLDDRAKPAQAAFYRQWFGLARLTSVNKDPAVYPGFGPTLRGAMAEETRAFVDHVLWQDDARLETLLTASYSFVNAPLAELYGVPPPSASGLSKTALDPARRAGVLTQASVLTAFSGAYQSSPVLRGVWVRVRLLCQDFPEPPAEVPPLPQLQAGVSNRERFALLTAEPACRGCHELIDGLGFGLEHYDGIGAYRERDQGLPVDASGEIRHTADIDGPFHGGPELARRLADSAQVRDCAATQWLRYALGRREATDDTCSLVALREAFAATRGNLQELMVALTQTDDFRSYRQPP